MNRLTPVYPPAVSPHRKTNGKLLARGEVLVEEFYRWHALEPVEVVLDEDGDPPLSPEAIRRGELALASGIRDDAILRILLDLDIAPEVVAAISLVPLVEVAWADGEMDPKERRAILDASHAQGIDYGSPAYDLLARWLEHPPGAALFDAWRAYIEAVFEPLTREEREAFRRWLIERARAVAKAAGGILGVGAISAEERRVLARLEAALREAGER